MMIKISKMMYLTGLISLFISTVKYSNVNQFPVLFSSCVLIGWQEESEFSWTKQDVGS